MSKSERFLLIVALLVGCLALLMGRGNGLLSAAMAQADGSGDDAAAEMRSGAGEPSGEIAYVGGLSVLFDLLESERYKPEMEELNAEAEEALAQFDERMNELRGEFENIDQSDPEAMQSIQQRAQQLQAEQQATQQQWQQRIAEAQAANFQEAFNEMRASAQAIAESQGFKYVLFGEDPETQLREGVSGNPAQEMLMRNVLVAPEGTDITADVRADLNLD